MKVSTVNQAITASAAVVTAAASIVVASAAWQTVELARHEWIIVPAPANAEGRLTRAGVHLTWELAERHADIMRGFQVLMGPSPRAGETPRGQRVVTEHGLATESWVPLCIEGRPEELPDLTMCFYRVQARDLKDCAGHVSQPVTCFPTKCGFVPDGGTTPVWQDEY